MKLQIRLERDDSIPAFGAFLRAEAPGDTNHVILLNVSAAMWPDAEYEDGTSAPMSRSERKRAIISNLMHEFGHCLEYHFNEPVNEEAIEVACEAWESVAQSVEAADLNAAK